MMEPFVGPDSKLFYKVLDHDDIASVIDDFAVGRRARPRGGHRRLRAPRRARLPDRRLPVAGQEPPHRRVRRHPVEHRRAPAGRDPAGVSSARRRRLRALVPAELHREPARRHHASTTASRSRGSRSPPAPTRCTCRRTTIPASRPVRPTRTRRRCPGLLLDNARAVKDAIDAPVIAVGRIDPDAADAAIADGAFDFVSMARMILAEPELPNLLAAGRPEEIRPCVYHYRCIGNIFVRGQVRCAANGSVGREDELVIGHGRRHRGRCWSSAAVRRGWKRRGSRRCAGTRSRWSTPRRVSVVAGRTRPRPRR